MLCHYHATQKCHHFTETGLNQLATRQSQAPDGDVANVRMMVVAVVVVVVAVVAVVAVAAAVFAPADVDAFSRAIAVFR